MSEDKRISELLAKTSPLAADLLVIVDSSEANVDVRTKRITAGNLFASPLPIGNVTPSTAFFTQITIDGSLVTEISNDDTLASSSATTLVTQQAIKQYVDNAITNIEFQIQDRIEKDKTSVTCYDDGTNNQSIIFRTESYPIVSDTTSSYYFNSYATSDWLNPQNMVDNNLATYSMAPNSAGTYTQRNNTNTTPTGLTDIISSVRFRVYGYYPSGATLSTFTLQPIFNGSTFGDIYPITGLIANIPQYSNWIDITSDSNAPGTWTFDDISNLDTIISATTINLGYVVGKIEIEVLHQPLEPGIEDVFKIDLYGITLLNSPKIGEFSTDGSLTDNSDNIVPTQQAVKTYVDSQVGSVITNKIWENDSSVEVSSDNILFEIDTLLIGEINNDVVRLGYLDDYHIILDEDKIRYGYDNDTTVLLDKNNDSFSVYSDGTNVLSLEVDKLTIGQDNIVIDKNAPPSYMSFNLSNLSSESLEYSEHNLLYLEDDFQYLGKLTDTSIILDNTAIGFSIDQEIILSITEFGIKLQEDTGISVNRITNDGSLTQNSSTSLVTERAVKSYVDNQVMSLLSSRIFNEDSSVEVFNSGTPEIVFTIDSVYQGKFDPDGLTLSTGVSVNHISNDPTLIDASQTALVTEYAVKQYIDTNISQQYGDRIISGLAEARVFDSTSDSYFTVKLRDNVIGNDETTTTQVFYFNDLSNDPINDQTSTNWLMPQNMIDGNISSYSQAGAAAGLYLQVNSNNIIPPSFSQTIEKVEIRLYGRNGLGPNISVFNMYPVFNGTTGNSHNLRSVIGQTKTWTPWINITDDPYAPQVWSWSDIQNLNIKIEAIIGNPGGSVGDILEVFLIEFQVTYKEAPYITDQIEKFRVNYNGISVEYGTTINEFSTDTFLTDSSDRAIPTERAVKTYVDYHIQSLRNDLDLINIRHIDSNTTAVTGDVCLVDTTDGHVNISMTEIPDGRIIIKKTSNDINKIFIRSSNDNLIDGEEVITIDVPYKSFTFLSDGDKFFII